MNYPEVLPKLERLLALCEECVSLGYVSSPTLSAVQQQIAELYGELEDVVESIVGSDKVLVEGPKHGLMKTYPNYIEAGFLSGRTFYAQDGLTQLRKVIGKVRQRATDPAVPRDEASISALVRILGRFRECCQYVKEPPANERDVRDLAWVMLRSQFDRVDREETLQRFGAKQYRPDFGVPELRTLIEVKFVGAKTEVSAIQEEILADIPGYLSKDERYESVVALVYDGAQKLRDAGKFVEDLRSVDGILDVLVIPGIG